MKSASKNHMKDPRDVETEDDMDDLNEKTIRRQKTKKKMLLQKCTDKKVVVKVNEFGVLAGKGWTELVSYIGVLVRDYVSIMFDDWRAVPEKVTDGIWGNILNLFDLPPNSRKHVYSAMGVALKNFRSTLRTKFIWKFKNNREKLRSPPEKYKQITTDEWRMFVKKTFKEEFQAKSKKRRENRKKNIYNHRLGSTGYAGLIEKKKKELGSNAIVIDRSDTWLWGREKKGGGYDDSVIEVANEIKELKDKVAEGTFTPVEDKDVLAVALQKKPNGSRIQGVGHFITPTMYFHRPSVAITEKEKEKKICDKRYKMMLDKFDEMKTCMSNGFSEIGSCSIANKSKKRKSGGEVDQPICTPRRSPRLKSKQNNEDEQLEEGNEGNRDSTTAMRKSRKSNSTPRKRLFETVPKISPRRVKTEASPDMSDEEDMDEDKQQPQHKVKSSCKEKGKKARKSLSKYQSSKENMDEGKEQPLPRVQSFERQDDENDREPLSKFQSLKENMDEGKEQPLPRVQSFERLDDENDREPLSKFQSLKEDMNEYEEQPLVGVQSFQTEESKYDRKPLARFHSSKEDMMSEDEEQPLKKMKITTKPDNEVIEDNPEDLERCGVVVVKEKRAKMKAKPPLNMQRRTRAVAEKKRSPSANLQMFSILVENCLGDECTISHGAEIFGFETKSVFNKDVCRLVINFEEVSNSIIEIWSRYLHEQMINEGGEILVQFGTSSAVRKPKKQTVQSVTKRSQYIADLLGVALLGQITLIPYNTGNHWVLTAIDMARQTVYYLDSIGGSPVEDLESIVNQGVRIHHASTSKNRMNLKWVRVMCPKQAGGMECGYFVMKYMKDIASDVKLLEQNFSEIKEYSDNDILGIREEWATYAATLITMLMNEAARKT